MYANTLKNKPTRVSLPHVVSNELTPLSCAEGTQLPAQTQNLQHTIIIIISVSTLNH